MLNLVPAYLRRLAAADPILQEGVEVVNIEAISDSTMVWDLSDGTTIRIDFERYTR